MENFVILYVDQLVLTRIFSALGAVRMGYQIPDYTAYEDMINAHLHRVTPVLVRTHADERFRIAPDAFRHLVEAQRLDAYLMSNPCNPTGQVVQGEALAERVRVARAHDCTLILDEFYSHFIYTPEGLSLNHLEPSDHAYGPIGGTEAFREAVARHYNRLYRVGKASQYTAENVSVAAGGRLVLTRIFSATT